MNFIKKIFDKEIDPNTHLQFQKFSKGEFRNRAIIKAKVSGTKYTTVTTAEFVNEMVRIVAEKLGESKTRITGAIISTNDLTGELEFKDKEQFQGVKRYLIDKEISGKEIIELLNKFPKSFFALSFESDDTKLKIKPKAPKSGKSSSKKGEAPKPDFCRLVTTDKELGQSFVFEKPDFKDAEVNHTFIITGLIISDELKSSNDFAKIREEAKRKGKIIRKTIIDGQESTQEFDFEA